MEKHIISFIEYCTINKVSDKEKTMYNTELYEFSAYTNKDFSAEALDSYMIHLRDSSIKETVFKRKVDVLKVFYNFLTEKEIITVNPFAPKNALVETPKIETVIEVDDVVEKSDLFLSIATVVKTKRSRLPLLAIPATLVVVAVGIAAYYIIAPGMIHDDDTETVEPSDINELTDLIDVTDAPALEATTLDTPTTPPTSPATTPPTADVTQPTLTESPTQPPPSSAGTSRPDTPTKPTITTPSPTTSSPPKPTQPPTVNVGTPKISASKSNNSVTLSWAAITDADGYEVSRSTSMIGGYSVLNAIAVRDGSTIKVTDSGTNSGTTYYYSVRAFRNVGGVKNWGSHSEIVTVRG